MAIILTILTSTVQSQTERSVTEAKGLKVGTKAPMFLALDADSNIFSLKEAIHESPVVIIFYRGFWCPVCNKHLASIQDSLKMIEAKGVRVIAISPEKPEYLSKMASKSGAKYSLLYDEAYEISNAYDVTYKPTTMQLFTYNTFLGAKIKKTHTDSTQQLPIPATYLINKEGKIIWRQFDPNYKNRSSVKAILESIEANKSATKKPKTN